MYLTSTIAKLITLYSALRTSNAQVTTSCNPLEAVCPSDKGLASNTYSVDFTTVKECPPEWTLANYEKVTFGKDGAEFAFEKRFDAPSMHTNFNFFFGRVEYVMKAAPGVGIISSMVLLSDDLDEVDWEFRGGIAHNVQTNFFGKGYTGSYNRSTSVDLAFDPQAGFHTYALDWSPTSLVWSIDGKVVRTLAAAEAWIWYPQTPMRVSLSLWDGGDKDTNPATVEWAGGYTPLPPPQTYSMYVKSVKVWNANPAQQYQYTDKTGSRQSIKLLNDTVKANSSASVTQPKTTLSLAPTAMSQVSSMKSVANATSHLASMISSAAANAKSSATATNSSKAMTTTITSLSTSVGKDAAGKDVTQTITALSTSTATVCTECTKSVSPVQSGTTKSSNSSSPAASKNTTSTASLKNMTTTVTSLSTSVGKDAAGKDVTQTITALSTSTATVCTECTKSVSPVQSGTTKSSNSSTPVASKNMTSTTTITSLSTSIGKDAAGKDVTKVVTSLSTSTCNGTTLAPAHAPTGASMGISTSIMVHNSTVATAKINSTSSTVKPIPIIAPVSGSPSSHVTSPTGTSSSHSTVSSEGPSMLHNDKSTVAVSAKPDSSSHAGSAVPGSTVDVYTTAIVVTTVTSCPVTSTITTGSITSTKVTTTVSTITSTSISTVCTKCIPHPIALANPTPPHTNQSIALASPAPTHANQSISHASPAPTHSNQSIAAVDTAPVHSSYLSAARANRTVEIYTTEVLHTTVTSCPVTNTITSGSITSTQVKTTISTITSTSVSTVCTKCIPHPIALASPTPGQIGNKSIVAPAEGSLSFSHPSVSPAPTQANNQSVSAAVHGSVPPTPSLSGVAPAQANNKSIAAAAQGSMSSPLSKSAILPNTTVAVFTTEIIHTTVTSCPVTSTFTSGSVTSTQVMTTVSTITLTSTSTVCTQCVPHKNVPVATSLTTHAASVIPATTTTIVSTSGTSVLTVTKTVSASSVPPIVAPVGSSASSPTTVAPAEGQTTLVSTTVVSTVGTSIISITKVVTMTMVSAGSPSQTYIPIDSAKSISPASGSSPITPAVSPAGTAAPVESGDDASNAISISDMDSTETQTETNTATINAVDTATMPYPLGNSSYANGTASGTGGNSSYNPTASPIVYSNGGHKVGQSGSVGLSIVIAGAMAGLQLFF